MHINIMRPELDYKPRVTLPTFGGEIDTTAKSLYGISVGARCKSISEVAGGFKWAIKFFPNCDILIGDGLYRITLQIREGVDETIALGRAIEEGQKLLDEFRSVLKEPLPIVFRSSEIINNAIFPSAINAIDNLFKCDTDFSNSVRLDAGEFVDRQARRNCLQMEYGRAVQLAIRYLKEEIAIYLLMAQRGWLQDIYLGNELPTLLRIMKGDIPAAPAPLKRRINIALRAKGKTQR